MRCHTGRARWRTRGLILVHGHEVHEGWVRLAQTLPWVQGRGLTFAIATGDLRAAIAERREQEKDAAIGYIAADESAVLEALTSGADEAAVIAPYDAAQLAGFADRLDLRARLRAESQRLQDAFAHSERLMALGTLVAGVGHEINNPLSAVILSIDVARRRILPAIAAARAIAAAAQAGAPAPPDALATIAKHAAADQDGRIFDDMATAADAIASIVRDLRTFARADQDESPEHVAVDDLIERAIRLSGREATRRGVLERDYAADLPPLVLPRGRVTQVIMNVFINAFHAIAEVDRPKHRVKITARADEDFVAITVSDTGPGIPPEALERIFDPFFTTKRQGLGTGLGLSISRAILRRLGGELSVESVYGEGAAFVCFLPIPTPDLLARGARAAVVSNTSDESSTARSILVVDDDERILRSYARLLGARHRVMVAYDGREAIDLIRSGSSPDVLVIELDLPSDENHELLAWLQAERPDLVRRAILVTSGSGAGKSEGAFGGHPGPILLKPMHGEALLAAIDAAASQDAPRSWR